MIDVFKDFLFEVDKDLFERGAYWTPTLATKALDGHPHLRTVVLRETAKSLNANKISFFFHTDLRSKKWSELEQDPRSSLHFYCSKRKWQVRVKGTALPIKDGKRLEKMWTKISSNAQRIYSLASAPGTPSETHIKAMEFLETSAQGFVHFGAFEFRCTHFDSLKIIDHTAGSPYHERISWCLKSNTLQTLVP